MWVALLWVCCKSRYLLALTTQTPTPTQSLTSFDNKVFRFSAFSFSVFLLLNVFMCKILAAIQQTRWIWSNILQERERTQITHSHKQIKMHLYFIVNIYDYYLEGRRWCAMEWNTVQYSNYITQQAAENRVRTEQQSETQLSPSERNMLTYILTNIYIYIYILPSSCYFARSFTLLIIE